MAGKWRRWQTALLRKWPGEQLELAYQPSVRHDFGVELARNRAREQTFRSTILGPHRDDVQLTLDGQSAGKFASEGQKPVHAPSL